jgi:dynactin-4
MALALFTSCNGRKAPLHNLFFCTACLDQTKDEETVNPLRASNPADCIEDIDAYYCPDSLDTFSSQEAMLYLNRSPKCFECPSCGNTLRTAGEGSQFFFLCGYCRWNSKELGIVAERSELLFKEAMVPERESLIEKKFTSLQKNLVAKMKQNAESQRERRLKGLRVNVKGARPKDVWNWNNVEESLMQKVDGLKLSEVGLTPLFDLETAAAENAKTPAVADGVLSKWTESLLGVDPAPQEVRFKPLVFDFRIVRLLTRCLLQLYGAFDLAGVTGIEQRLTQPSEQPVDASLLRPRRKLLLTKRSLRCRVCVDAGRPGILVKPQINPLTGDSSMLAKSSWWKKATFASAYLPSIRLVQGATPQTMAADAGGAMSLIMLLTNPSDSEVRIAMGGVPTVAEVKAEGEGAGKGGEEGAVVVASESAALARLQKAQSLQKQRAEERQQAWKGQGGDGAGGTQDGARGAQQKAVNGIELPGDSITIAAWEDPNLLDEDDMDEV